MPSSSCCVIGRRFLGTNGRRHGFGGWPFASRCVRSAGSDSGRSSVSSWCRPLRLRLRGSTYRAPSAVYPGRSERRSSSLLRGSAGRRHRGDPRLFRADGAGPPPSRSQPPATAAGRGRRCRLTDACAKSSGRRPPRSSPMSSDSSTRRGGSPTAKRRRGYVAAPRRSRRRRSDPPPPPERPEHRADWTRAIDRTEPGRLGVSVDARLLPADRGHIHSDPRTGSTSRSRGTAWVGPGRCGSHPPAQWSCLRLRHSCRAPAYRGSPSPLPAIASEPTSSFTTATQSATTVWSLSVAGDHLSFTSVDDTCLIRKRS